MKVDDHFNKLISLNWSYFVAASYARDALKTVRAKVNTLCNLFQRYKDAHGKRNHALQLKKASPDKASKGREVTAAFRNLLKTVKLAENEYHTEIDPAKKFKKSGGKPTIFLTCVAEAVKDVMKHLRGTADYEPIFLTDEEMAIDKFGDVCNISCLTYQFGRHYRF